MRKQSMLAVNQGNFFSPGCDYLIHFQELAADTSHSQSHSKMEKLVVSPKFLK